MNRDNRPAATVINLREVVWDLLSHWKAVLIVSLLAMLIVGGLKYAKDMNAYNAASDKAAAEQAAAVTPEEKIEEILDTLSADERATVEYLVMQDDWVNTEKEYVANSLLMNTNPTNQRTLTLDYLISTSDSPESNTVALLNGYASSLSNDKVTASLGKAIDPEADSKYIAELIRTNRGGNYSADTGKAVLVNADDDGTVLSVYVALPDDADIAAVESAITDALMDCSDELGKKIGAHKIELIQSSETYLFNTDAVTNRNNVLYSIYNLINNTKNLKTSLSDAQKSALDSILSIKKEYAGDDTAAAPEAVETEEQTPKPGFSKKYALLGFILGAFAYAFVYLMLVIMKGKVNSAADIAYYTQSRMLGEVYGNCEAKGFSKVLRSRFFEKLRYKGRTDVESQIAKAVDAIDAVCEREKAKHVRLIDLTGKGGEQIDAIVKGAAEKGTVLDVVDASAGLDEKSLLDMGDAVLVTGPGAKVSALTGILSLFADYNVKMLGSIYVDPEAIA